MTVFQFSNFAQTTLANGLTPSETTGTLALGTGSTMPALSTGQQFAAVLTDAATKTVKEVVYVTAISGDVVTMTRGQEGTTAGTWATGSLFGQLPTAGVEGKFLQFGQIVPRVPASGTGSFTANTTLTLTASLTAPVAGQVWAHSNFNLNQPLTISATPSMRVTLSNFSAKESVIVRQFLASIRAKKVTVLP